MPKPPVSAKPSSPGVMPEVSAPQNPGYFAMQPGVREIQGPSFAFGVAGGAPSFTGAQQYNAQSASAPTVGGPSLPGFEAQQGSVNQVGASYSPTAITPQQIGANYSAQSISAPNLPSFQAQSVSAPNLPSYSAQGAAPASFQQAQAA